jgi:hypothetical protein
MGNIIMRIGRLESARFVALCYWYWRKEGRLEMDIWCVLCLYSNVCMISELIKSIELGMHVQLEVSEKSTH